MIEDVAGGVGFEAGDAVREVSEVIFELGDTVFVGVHGVFPAAPLTPDMIPVTRSQARSSTMLTIPPLDGAVLAATCLLRRIVLFLLVLRLCTFWTFFGCFRAASFCGAITVEDFNKFPFTFSCY